MEILINIGFPIFILLVMLIFGLYTTRNVGWVLLCLAWGAVGYGIYYLLDPKFIEMGITPDHVFMIFAPIIQQVLVALGVLFVISREKFDNLIDGAVYGFAAGIGFSTCSVTLDFISNPGMDLQTSMAQSLPTTLVLGTASAITGLIMTQFYFRHRGNRIIILLSGLGAAIGYNALFNWLLKNSFVNSSQFGLIVPIAFGIGGLTLMSLYITGQLRKILIQLGIQKKRADGLLDIVIPIGVELSIEDNYGLLLEKMLVAAKSFCKADAGTLYLRKENLLEFAVVRNDTLNIAMGGMNGAEVTLPPLHLFDEATAQPNHSNVATQAALSGKTINVEDSYENKEFDFSGTREFDQRTGYMSVSFLTIPLKDSKGDVQGVLQLINALDSRKKQLVAFDQNLQQLMESFSSLASAALEGYIQEQSLRKEIQKLRIEIDQVKRDRQVEEITDSSYFKELKQRAQEIRSKMKDEN